jgi:hypothetical protein
MHSKSPLHTCPSILSHAPSIPGPLHAWFSGHFGSLWYLGLGTHWPAAMVSTPAQVSHVPLHCDSQQVLPAQNPLAHSRELLFASSGVQLSGDLRSR